MSSSLAAICALNDFGLKPMVLALVSISLGYFLGLYVQSKLHRCLRVKK